VIPTNIIDLNNPEESLEKIVDEEKKRIGQTIVQRLMENDPSDQNLTLSGRSDETLMRMKAKAAMRDIEVKRKKKESKRKQAEFEEEQRLKMERLKKMSKKEKQENQKKLQEKLQNVLTIHSTIKKNPDKRNNGKVAQHVVRELSPSSSEKEKSFLPQLGKTQRKDKGTQPGGLTAEVQATEDLDNPDVFNLDSHRQLSKKLRRLEQNYSQVNNESGRNETVHDRLYNEHIIKEIIHHEKKNLIEKFEETRWTMNLLDQGVILCKLPFPFIFHLH
jgi:hypothetical protein